MSSIVTTHIEVDGEGVAWIADSRVKVIEIAIDKLAHGSSPEEMAFQYTHLSLAQIHAALAYYYDHQIELDAQIEARRRKANVLVAQNADPALRRKLASLKRGNDAPTDDER
jgi:uncharacterized protein (DUF433 family)